MATYMTPGVYIEEVTGPGVIAGVGTSTAAFLGPALRGPIDEPTLVTSFDEFVARFGGTRDGRPWPYVFNGSTPFYMAFAVEGFFTNGGQYAYIVRVGTAAASAHDLTDQGGGVVAHIEALQDGLAGDGINVGITRGLAQALVQGSANIAAGTLNAARDTFDVDRPTLFAVGDVIQDNNNTRAQITRISGSTVTVSAALSVGAASIRIADIQAPQREFRVAGTYGLRAGGTAILDDTNNNERVVVQSVNETTRVVQLTAAPANNYAIATATIEPVAVLAQASGTAVNLAGPQITLQAGEGAAFRVGDVVGDGANTAHVTAIQGDVLTVDVDASAWANAIVLAPFDPNSTTFRLESGLGVYPGTIAQLDDGANTVEVSVVSVTPGGLVQVDSTIVRAASIDPMAAPAPVMHSQEFRMVVTPPAAAPPGSPPAERFEGISLNEFHPRYLFNLGVVESEWVRLVAPDMPSSSVGANSQLAAVWNANLQNGADDVLSNIAAPQYEDGFAALAKVDDVNIVCIPDAAASPDRPTIQGDAIDHCLDLADRFAVLDSVRGAPPSGSGSVVDQRGGLQAERGFAALYYPWLKVRDPRSTGAQPQTLLVPPCGHMAGVYARTDQNPGVHKAPANTDVRGVLGLERVLGDREQGPLNIKGVNVLRIFPGSSQVTVWGARTTVDPEITDWLYVPVRRLMLYIEESIQEGIRWAVFKPNDLTLWKQLERSIGDFLTRVWQDEGLFGATAQDAFQVRIDEALNPPSERAVGRLHIEIKVAPVRPAEFIIVRIGLWDGGASVSES